MMGRLSRDRGQLFYSFGLDEAAPDDHPVREIASHRQTESLLTNYANDFCNEICQKATSYGQHASLTTCTATCPSPRRSARTRRIRRRIYQ